MARVKRGVTAHAKHKKVLKEAKGYLRPPQEHHPHRQAGGREGAAVRLSRPQAQEAQLPRAVDPAHQRRRARARPDLRPIYRRPWQGGHRGRPQGPGRPRRQRCRPASRPSSTRQAAQAQEGGVGVIPEALCAGIQALPQDAVAAWAARDMLARFAVLLAPIGSPRRHGLAG